MSMLREITKHWLKNRKIFAVILAVALMSVESSGAVRTVTTTAELNAAVNNASTGDTIKISENNLELNVNNITNSVKKVTFIGDNSVPDQFRVLTVNLNSGYGNEKFDFFFEKLIIKSSNGLGNGSESSNTRYFKDCIIKDCAYTFCSFSGDNSKSICPTLIFENCLFFKNTKPIIKINFWGTSSVHNTPKLKINNCTFDNNTGALFSFENFKDLKTDSMFITNSIFSGTGTIPDESKNMITYSFINDGGTGYGNTCVVGENSPLFSYGEGTPAKPSDWIILGNSPAKGIGNDSTAPQFDIAGNERGDAIDAGCWVGESGGAPKLESLIPAADTIQKGGDAQFVVNITGGKPFAYWWYKVADGDDIAVGSSTNCSNIADTLLLENVTFDSDGKYYCIVSNSVADSSLTTDTVTLIVIDTPKIVSVTPAKSTFFEGEKVVFTVNASGGLLEYQWYKNDVELAGETSSTLEIDAIGIEDTTYKCVVTNSIGSKDTTFSVEITGNAPQITVQPIGTTVFIGDEVTFSVTAIGKSPFKYEWFKVGTSAAVDTNLVYTISSAALADSGSYYCIVSNESGKDTSDAVKLEIYDKTQPFNPVKLVDGTFIDRETVSFKVSGLSQIVGIDESVMSADSIGIWYEDGKFPSAPDLKSKNLVKLSIEKLIENDSLCTLSVAKKDDCFSYYFVGSVLWQIDGEDDITVSAFNASNGSSVYMCSTEKLEHPLEITSKYTPSATRITITISGFDDPSFDKESVSSLKLWCEDNTLKSVFDTTIREFPSKDTYFEFEDKTPTSIFKKDTQSVTWKLLLTGVLGNASDTNLHKVTIGVPRPKNNIKPNVVETKANSVKLTLVNQLAETYDSIKVWYSTEEIPDNPPSDPTFKCVTIEGNLTEDTVVINKLEENTLYHYAVQVLKTADNKAYWSSMLRASVTTSKNVDPEKLDNTITITKASFNKETNTVSVSFSVDTAGIGQYLTSNKLQLGINWSLNTYPQTAPGLTDPVIYVTSDTFSYEFSLGQSMLFDTLYYISSWLRIADKTWSSFSEDAGKTVEIPSIEWQEFTFDQSLTDTVNVFNRKVYLWMDSLNPNGSEISLTLDKFTPESIPDGFIPVSTGIEFRIKAPSPWFNLGIKCDSIPSGYSISDVNIYMLDTLGKWKIIRNTSVDPVNSVLSFSMHPGAPEYKAPFILMIDKQEPVVTLTSEDTISALTPMTDLEVTLNVEDNISNVKVELWCGPGQEKLNLSSNSVGSDYAQDFKLVIPGTMITPVNGVRALLIITDERFSDTINVSRKVYRNEASDAITTVPMKWVPLVTTTNLYEKSIDNVLKDFQKEGVFNYDNTMFRVYRYGLKPDQLENEWIEYSDDEDIKSLFDLVPGRVLWIKTRDEVALRLGAGETVSLKEPYSEIELKPRDWTDFSLPFSFDVYLGDIFDSSKIDDKMQDDIEVYSWQSLSSNLSSVPVFHTGLPEDCDPNTVLTHSDVAMYEERLVRQTYTIYSDMDKTVTLRIPSEPAAMSKRSAQPELLAKRNSSNGWSVKVNAKTHDEVLNPVICGYSQGKGKTYLKKGPGFSNVRVWVQNPENNSLWGHVVNHELTDGGTVVPLVIENSSKSSQRVNLEIEKGNLVPENTKVVFVNPENKKGQYLSKMEINVDGGTSKNGWLLAGDSAFVANWYNQIVNTEFSLVRLFPNPCRGKLMVRFTVPYMNVNEIKMTVYDQLGRRVWAKNVNKRLQPGLNVVQCDISSKDSFAAGTYIFNIQAIDHKGRVVGTKRNRLTYLP